MAERILSTSSAYTEAWGQRLGALLAPGDKVALTGPLGAGKTQLVRGVVAGYFGVGHTARVCSPSFTVMNTYDFGAKRVHHMDLYRLNSVDDLESTGYWDALAESPAVVLIEWLAQVPEARPEGCLELGIDFVPDAVEARTFSLLGDVSATWRDRLAEIWGP